MTVSESGGIRPFEPARGRRVFDDIISQLRERLKSGQLRPGDRLPSERELAEHFSVSRNTVREALRMLEIAGLVKIKKGATGGAFIADGDPAVVSRSLADMLTLSSFTLTDLLEVRLWTGAVIARVACERGTEADFDALEANIRQAEALADDWERRAEVNHEFFDLLAAATHNPVMALVQRSITSLIREIVATIGPVPSERLLESKRQLLDRLRERDPDKAVAQMEAHLMMVHELWLSKSASKSGGRGGG